MAETGGVFFCFFVFAVDANSKESRVNRLEMTLDSVVNRFDRLYRCLFSWASIPCLATVTLKVVPAFPRVSNPRLRSPGINRSSNHYYFNAIKL